jgi:DNA-binding transcriptional regulator YbjK
MQRHKQALGTAAVAVLAEQGGRAFTHRAVDRRAGLPEGTASRYARTRAALLELASEALFAEDSRAIAEAITATRASSASKVRDADELPVLLLQATKALLQAPDRYRARVELQLESARTAALRHDFHRARDAFITPLSDVLVALGHPQPHATADILICTLDGLLHRQLVIGLPPFPDCRVLATFATLLDERAADKMRSTTDS